MFDKNGKTGGFDIALRSFGAVRTDVNPRGTAEGKINSCVDERIKRVQRSRDASRKKRARRLIQLSGKLPVKIVRAEVCNGHDAPRILRSHRHNARYTMNERGSTETIAQSRGTVTFSPARATLLFTAGIARERSFLSFHLSILSLLDLSLCITPMSIDRHTLVIPSRPAKCAFTIAAMY